MSDAAHDLLPDRRLQPPLRPRLASYLSRAGPGSREFISAHHGEVGGIHVVYPDFARSFDSRSGAAIGARRTSFYALFLQYIGQPSPLTWIKPNANLFHNGSLTLIE